MSNLHRRTLRTGSLRATVRPQASDVPIDGPYLHAARGTRVGSCL